MEKPHDHSHRHGHHHDHPSATGNIAFAFVLNLFFAIVELIGGFLTNSVAIISDAVHDFGDALSLSVTWYLQKKSDRGSDARYSYGYKRFSLLGALFISVVLLVGSIFVIRAAVLRIITPAEANAQGMFWLAIFGLVVNGVAALRLSKGKSISERAVMLHMMEDVLGWAAVLVVSIVMMFVHAPILDPLLSIGISVWVLFNVYRNIKAALGIMLQQVPEDVDLSGVEKSIMEIPSVDSYHDVHLWSMDGEQNIMTIHIVTKSNLSQQDLISLKQQIREICKTADIGHVTIEFELTGEECDD